MLAKMPTVVLKRLLAKAGTGQVLVGKEERAQVSFFKPSNATSHGQW